MSMRPIRLCLTGNEPRQRYLFEELGHVADVQASVGFDQIDPFTKYLAAALSFSWPRSEWWENYHMHPLVQARRRKVLLRGMQPYRGEIDALLMWGSWFQPFPADRNEVPYFHYIDQSHSLENLPGERKGRFARRHRAHRLQGECYAASSAIFTMSQWARQQTLEAHQVAEDKVIAVGWGPCAVDLSAEPMNQQREPMVLHISNDFYRKGIDYLIQTAAKVRAVIPNARFLVVGRDSSGFDVPASSDVEILGPIYDKPRLTDMFRRASAFFLPHRFDRSPHVLVEAMSAGLPLVASSQGGAVEVIGGKDTGFLCQPGAIDEYATALISLLRDADLRNRMGGNGLALMRERYNWPSIARRITEVIRRNARIA